MLIMLLVLLTVAQAHDAGGWSYPPECCAGQDCRRVACDQVVETKNGWTYLPSGAIFSPWKVHPSQDRYCHACMNNKDQNGICLFIQQGS